MNTFGLFPERSVSKRNASKSLAALEPFNASTASFSFSWWHPHPQEDAVSIFPAAVSLKFGNIVLEPDTGRVFVDGHQVELLKKEFSILDYFMRRPGHLVDKTVLAEAIWGDHIDQADDFQFLYAQMKNLRKKE